MAAKQVLFIDTNIWLDFYRARNETGLRLLEHIEAISDRLIVTYQLESEFKTNRQRAIQEGLRELKPPTQVPRLGIFSDAAATRVMERSHRDVEKRVNNLTKRLGRVLENPALHDPVYKICQRIFHKADDLTLRREDKTRRVIRRRAFRRFLHGCPPRKSNDTSIGDAINWEWMVHCATTRQANLVIVSRDADYGVTVGGKSYINDHLRQEFSERVSKKRKLTLYQRLSDALKLFSVPVSRLEEESEKELVSQPAAKVSPTNFLQFVESVQGILKSLSMSELESLTPEQYAEQVKQLKGKGLVPLSSLRGTSDKEEKR